MPETTDLSDHELVQAALENRAEFRELYWRYGPKIYQFVRYRINSKEDAEDIVSDVFTKVLAKLHTYNSAQLFSAWIYTIARNVVIDFWRKQKVTINMDDVTELCRDRARPVPTQDDNIDAGIAAEYIMSKLSPDEKILVTLRFIDDLPYKDIAKITGKSESALRTVFSRLKNTFNSTKL